MNVGTEQNSPVTSEELKRRKEVSPTQRPPGGRFTLSSFTLPDGDDVELTRDEKGAYHLVATTKRDGVRPGAPIQRLEVDRLDGEALARFGGVRELDGHRPEFTALRSWPRLQRPGARPVDGEDLPTNVFQPDSRFVYQDTTFPWRTVGRVWTANGSGAGCTIGPRLVLTASHVVDWNSDGTVGWAKFSPGYYNGNGPWGEFQATRVVYWNKAMGGLTDLETAFDYAVLVMDDRVGDQVGYPGYRSYDDSWNGDDVWQHMGYPGDLTGTQRPAFVGNAVVSSTSDESLNGQDGLVMGHFNDTTGGHSGGPVWGWWASEAWPRVVGVQSAAAAVPAFNTSGDNEFGGGSALSALIGYARSNYA